MTHRSGKPTGNAPVWDVAVRELQRLVREHPQGDALIFMPGAYEIAHTVQAVRDVLGPEFVVFPLHGELAPRDQDAAVGKYDRRKIVVATNVAETSLTIDGVRLVIDSGLARIRATTPTEASIRCSSKKSAAPLPTSAPVAPAAPRRALLAPVDCA